MRARVGVPLRVMPDDPAADAAALARLCVWAQRYTPRLAPFGPAEACHGLHLDVTGACHLHGGEGGLLADLARRLAEAGIPARLVLADSPGAGFALARYGAEDVALVPAGGAAAAMAPLPVEALRCAPATAVALKRLGLKRVGALIGAPRAPLARRFGLDLVQRLDQALGDRPEPLAALAEPARYGAGRGFLDPILHQEAVVAAARALMARIAPALEADGLGARLLRLTLHRVDGVMRALDLALSRPSRCPDAFAALLRLRLDRLGSGLDAGFGFESLSLDVVAAERMPDRQADLGAASPVQDIADLADRLRQRLGRPLIRLTPRASHLPERADRIAPWSPHAPEMADWTPPALPALPARPLVLLTRSEPAEDVLALVPEGPPRRFRWRARRYLVAHAEGPERIGPEWWRTDPADMPERDYYVVECETGHRLWLYRSGPHAPGQPAAWFVHGLFA